MIWTMLFLCLSFTTHAAPDSFALPGLKIEQSTAVNLGNGLGEAMVFKARDDSSRTKPWVIGIARRDAAGQTWQVLHQSRYFFDSVVGYQVAALLPGKVQQVILTQRAGSGGFLSYDVIGAVDGRLQTLLSRSQIFLGNVRVHGDLLIEENGDLATAWVWQGDHFVSRPYEETTPVLRAGDLVVRYGINEAGFAWIEEAKVILKPGSRLYLRREGAGGVARVLYRANQVIEHDGASYVAKNTGVTDIVITPGGYDHDKAAKIDVEVRE